MAERRERWRMRGRAAPVRLLAMLAFVLFSLLVVAAPRAEGPPASGAAIVLDVEGAIGPATSDYIARGLADAAERDAAIVVLVMDTPGGLVSATREIVRAILASPVPVATFVAPSGARAASAGTYILYASGLAAMAPGTNLGAATPISLGGGGQLPGEEEDDAPADAGSAKAVSDAAAFLRSLAELHGRDTDFAERAVREAASLSATAALEAGVVEVVAADVPALLRQADGMTVRTVAGEVTLDTADAPIVALEPTTRDRILGAISNPNLAYIFMLVGLYGIIFEFANPGTIFSGVIGAVALLIGLYALNVIASTTPARGLSSSASP